MLRRFNLTMILMVIVGAYGADYLKENFKELDEKTNGSLPVIVALVILFMPNLSKFHGIAYGMLGASAPDVIKNFTKERSVNDFNYVNEWNYVNQIKEADAQHYAMARQIAAQKAQEIKNIGIA